MVGGHIQCVSGTPTVERKFNRSVIWISCREHAICGAAPRPAGKRSYGGTVLLWRVHRSSPLLRLCIGETLLHESADGQGRAIRHRMSDEPDVFRASKLEQRFSALTAMLTSVVRRAPAWCMDRLVGAEKLGIVGKCPFLAPGCPLCRSS